MRECVFQASPLFKGHKEMHDPSILQGFTQMKDTSGVLFLLPFSFLYTRLAVRSICFHTFTKEYIYSEKQHSNKSPHSTYLLL